MADIEELIGAAEDLLRMVNPSDRQKAWRGWRNRVAALVRRDDRLAAISLELKLDTLADDLTKLRGFCQRQNGTQNVNESKNQEKGEQESLNSVSAENAQNGKIGVFVSHRSKDDQEIANTIRDKLRILSHGKIETHICENIRGGDDWFQWVENTVYQSTVFLLLYTDEEMDLRWCLFEAGLFRGEQKQQAHLICLKNTNISTPPSPLQRFQAYNADEAGLREFLRELLYRGSFTDGKKINPELLDQDETEFGQAVKDVELLFVERQINRNYFRKRIEIICPDVEPGTELNGNNPVDLEEFHIEAGELTRDLLDLPDGDVLWSDLYDNLNDKGHRWVDEIREVFEAVQDQRPIRQVLSSFASANGRDCLPLLSRVEHVKDRPKLMSVIFVEREVIEEEADLADSLLNAPQPMMTIIQLLNLARRFRWNILEAFIGKLEHGTFDSSAKLDILGDLKDAFTRILAESEEKGYLQIEAIVQAMPGVSRDVIKEMFESFKQDSEMLSSAMDKANIEGVVASLRRMRTVNKKFMLIALAEYTSRISLLEPRDIKSIEDIPTDMERIDTSGA